MLKRYLLLFGLTSSLSAMERSLPKATDHLAEVLDRIDHESVRKMNSLTLLNTLEKKFLADLPADEIVTVWTRLKKIEVFAEHLKSVIRMIRYVIRKHSLLPFDLSQFFLKKIVLRKLHHKIAHLVMHEYQQRYDWQIAWNILPCSHDDETVVSVPEQVHFYTLADRKLSVQATHISPRVTVSLNKVIAKIMYVSGKKDMFLVIYVMLVSTSTASNATGFIPFFAKTYHYAYCIDRLDLATAVLQNIFNEQYYNYDRSEQPKDFPFKLNYVLYSDNGALALIKIYERIILIDIARSRCIRSFKVDVPLLSAIFLHNDSIVILLLRTDHKHSLYVMDTENGEKISVEKVVPLDLHEPRPYLSLSAEPSSFKICYKQQDLICSKDNNYSSFLLKCWLAEMSKIMNSNPHALSGQSRLLTNVSQLFKKSFFPLHTRMRLSTEQNQEIKQRLLVEITSAQPAVSNASMPKSTSGFTLPDYRKTYLSLDAVGMHACFVTEALIQIEDMLGDDIVKYFDVVSGSHFGAIAGLGIVASFDAKTRLLSTTEIAELIESEASAIFGAKHTIKNAARFDNKHLSKVVRNTFKSSHLEDCIARFMLPCACISTKNRRADIKPLVYDRNRAQRNADYDVSLAELCLYAIADNKHFAHTETHNSPAVMAASTTYDTNSAQFLYDELLSHDANNGLFLSIIAGPLSESHSRTNTRLKERLGNDYLRIKAPDDFAFAEVDNYLPDTIEGYKETAKITTRGWEAFFRKLQEHRMQQHKQAIPVD